MKITKWFVVMLVSIAVAACGGGGGDNTDGGGNTSGTAAQYFTKKAVGNTWTYLVTEPSPTLGQPPTTFTSTDTITASSGGVVTISDPAWPSSMVERYYLDVTGALIREDVGSNGTIYWTQLELPPTFSVGTTWVREPADQAAGTGGSTAEIMAFNNTVTVPAGTFTDCLRVNSTWYSIDSATGTTTATGGAVFYYSPTAGKLVYVNENSGQQVWELQSYVANP